MVGKCRIFAIKLRHQWLNAELLLWVDIMWVDPNLNEFYSRVSRIEKTHAKGYGFEAAGTLGRKAPSRTGSRILKLMKPLVLALLVGIGLKSMIHYYIGAQTYESRVSALAAGEGIDPVGAWLMHADPATLFVSGQMQALFPR
jgi:hypothetical protein